MRSKTPGDPGEEEKGAMQSPKCQRPTEKQREKTWDRSQVSWERSTFINVCRGRKGKKTPNGLMRRMKKGGRQL